MARECSVCARDDVEAINLAILSGDSLRVIARRFSSTGTGPSRSALHRHQACLPRALAVRDDTALPPIAPPLPITATARAHVARVIADLDEITRSARASGNDIAAIAALRTKILVMGRAGMLENLDTITPTNPSQSGSDTDDGLNWLKDATRFVLTGEVRERAMMVREALAEQSSAGDVRPLTFARTRNHPASPSIVGSV